MAALCFELDRFEFDRFEFDRFEFDLRSWEKQVLNLHSK